MYAFPEFLVSFRLKKCCTDQKFSVSAPAPRNETPPPPPNIKNPFRYRTPPEDAYGQLQKVGTDNMRWRGWKGAREVEASRGRGQRGRRRPREDRKRARGEARP